MSHSLSRRQLLQAAACHLAAPVVCNAGLLASPSFRLDDVRVISCQPSKYHGWPTLARDSNGQLLLAYSGNREAHVCPFGRVELMRSNDNGRTWDSPRALTDSPIDDRDAGVVETQKGSILVTTFTSLAYEPLLEKASKIPADAPGAWPAAKLKRWSVAHSRLSESARRNMLGVWMLRSTDGGSTFSEPYRCLVNSPHGPIQLSDGRLLYAGKNLWEPEPWIGVCQSSDDGKTWTRLGEIPARAGDAVDKYHELHAVEAEDGRLIVQIRNHNAANQGETLQTESTDGGESWSIPRTIGVWGLPSHLLRLHDGRLLMSYGYRRRPFGNQARVSEDGGLTWSEPLPITEDGTSGDLGYPTTAQLDDGSLITVWYERLRESPMAVLRQARWVLT